MHSIPVGALQDCFCVNLSLEYIKSRLSFRALPERSLMQTHSDYYIIHDQHLL